MRGTYIDLLWSQIIDASPYNQKLPCMRPLACINNTDVGRRRMEGMPARAISLVVH